MKEPLIQTAYRLPPSILKKLSDDSRKQTAAAGKRVSRKDIVLRILQDHYATEKEPACQASERSSPTK